MGAGSVGWITGLILYFAYPSNKTVRFHAIQSMLLQIAITPITVSLVLLQFLIFNGTINIDFSWGIIILLSYDFLLLIIYIALMVVAYKEQKWKLPIIGNLADKWASK